MKLISFLFCVCTAFVFFACTKSSTSSTIPKNMSVKEKPLTYLALGDSYTIGESVSYDECFPAQTQKLIESIHAIEKPVIVATTGWTTDELSLNITKRKIEGTFDFVSLLIGVNNQYRGRDTANYRKEFTQLLDTAIRYAGNNIKNVFVISIPDWGITPFGINSGRDTAQISKEIDWFNGIAKWITETRGITFIDITPHSRTAKNDATLIAQDGLHPSGKMYTEWAQKLSEKMKLRIQ